MITPTHVVLHTAWVAHRRRGQPLRTRDKWFIVGGFAPDVGLYALTLGAAIYYPLTGGLSLEETFRKVFDDLYFTSVPWIITHNLLHAPLVLGAMWVVASVPAIRARRGAASVRAFALGCAVHAVLDIAVHHDDGPLLLFPVQWSLRFASPLSYWDPNHYGNVLGPIDAGITVLGTAAIIVWMWRRRRAGRLGRSNA